MVDLPVAVELAGELGREVSRYVEVEAGWQVVETGGPLAPVLTVGSAPAAPGACVVVVEGTPTPEQVRAHLLGGALDVLGWPDDRARLLDAPLRVRDEPVIQDHPALLRVVGTAGGVGTSTVALAMAGLAAWAGRRVAIVGDDDLLALCGLDDWTGPGASELLALDPQAASAEFPTVARPVPGLSHLLALKGAGSLIPPATPWPVDAIISDLRTAPAAGWPDGGGLIVVARPDGSLRRAQGSRSPVIVVGRGPLDRSGVRHCLGRKPEAWLPFSARVARAGLAGRVPSSLPGSWLAALRAPFVQARRAG